MLKVTFNTYMELSKNIFKCFLKACYLLVIPALGRHRQKNSHDSLVSQPSIIVELRPVKDPISKDNGR